MFKAGNKQWTILLKTVNVKHFFGVSSVDKTGKFKKLFVTHKPWIKNIGHKTGAAEDKINLKHCHHLFFKKILKKFTKKLSKPGASLDIWIRLFSLEKKILKKLNSFGKSFSLIQTLNPEKFKSEQVLCSGGKLNFYQPDNSNKWRLRNNFWQNVQHYSNKLYI